MTFDLEHQMVVNGLVHLSTEFTKELAEQLFLYGAVTAQIQFITRQPSNRADAKDADLVMSCKIVPTPQIYK